MHSTIGKKGKGGEVVDLTTHLAPLTQKRHDAKAVAVDEPERMAFGARISRSGEKEKPANEGIGGLLSRLVIDDSLPYYVSALDGTLIYVNDQYEILDAKLGDTTLAPGPARIGVGRRVPSILTVIEDVRATGKTVRAEEAAFIEGRERIFLGRHMPVQDESGSLLAVAGTYEDITLQVCGIEEITKTHAKFQDFTRASADWFFETGADMRIVSLSERFTALVGQPASRFIGAALSQFGRFEKNLEGRLDGQRSIDARKPFRDLLFIMDGPAGEVLRFYLSGVPVFDRKTGDFQGFRGVGMDVNARFRQAEESTRIRANLEQLLEELTRKNLALDEANEQAKMALRAKDEFLATMSHELRTPLNAIIGFADSFSRETFGALTKQYTDYAGDIGRSGRHLLSLINDILDVAVIEGGGLRLHLSDVILEHTLEKAVHMTLDAALAKNIDTRGLDQLGETLIRADDKRLTQIFVNLLTNAVKFTPEGGSIGVDLSVNSRMGSAHLVVWDTGVGIAEMYQEDIFEKFKQVTEDIYSRSQEGTGLGLHISRELARRMGGEISVSSIEGEGSRFTVALPLAKTNETTENDNFI